MLQIHVNIYNEIRAKKEELASYATFKTSDNAVRCEVKK